MSKTIAPGPAPDGGPANLTFVPATTIIEPDECPAGTEGAFVVVTFRIIGQGVCAPTMPPSPLFRRLRTRLHCCSRRMPPLLDHAVQEGVTKAPANFNTSFIFRPAEEVM